MTVRSSSSLCVRVPNVYNLTSLPVLLVEMSHIISDDKRKKSKKNLRPQGRSLSLYLCMFSPNVTILETLIHLEP